MSNITVQLAIKAKFLPYYFSQSGSKIMIGHNVLLKDLIKQLLVTKYDKRTVLTLVCFVHAISLVLQ